MSTNKLRVITDFEKLPIEIQERIKLTYPEGFSRFLIEFKNKNNETVSALPFETDDKYYMVRMSVRKAIQIISDDEDYDDEGLLKEHKKDQFDEKYGDIDDIEDEEDEDYGDEPEEDDGEEEY
jgi:hypothetical protein